MKKGDLRKKNGFTIIEVALVIAIAGLIFLMVFVALPQLQRQQRDSRRRDDILSFLETVKKYQTNNRGALPETDKNLITVAGFKDDVEDGNTWQNFYNDYLGNSFTDPDGNFYQLSIRKCRVDGKSGDCQKIEEGTPSSMDHVLHIYVQATCDGSEKAVTTSNPRNIAVLYRMEGSGMYCANT